MNKLILIFFFQILTITLLAQPVISYQRTHCNPGAPSGGSIQLNISGQTSYTITWFDGSNQSAKYSLSPGSYSVTVANQNGWDSKNIKIGNDVIWDDIDNMTVNGDYLTKTVPAGWYNCEVNSLNQTTPNQDGNLSFTVSRLNAYAIIGLAEQNNLPLSHKDFEFSIYVRKDDIYILEYGANMGNYGKVAIGDELEIRIWGGNVSYLKNGDFLRTTTINHNVPYFVGCSMHSVVSGSPDYELDAITSFGYKELPYDDTYANLTNKPNDRSPHIITNNKLRFKIDERYEVVGNIRLEYAIYDWERTDLSTTISGPTLTKTRGNNYYEITLGPSFNIGEFYTLEVELNKNETAFLRFKL